jgi:hypothetical protein
MKNNYSNDERGSEANIFQYKKVIFKSSFKTFSNPFETYHFESKIKITDLLG